MGEVSEVNDAKRKAFDTAVQELDKKYGQGTIICMGDMPRSDIDVISSGCLSLDHALGVGGYPRGRVIEIFGAESSGKTTLALHAVAQAQMQGGLVAYVDAEHSLDPVYAESLGVDIDSLGVSQPDAGEQALEIVEALARSGAVDLIVVDSVASLVPRAELEGDMGDSHVGLQARLMSQALRKLTGIVHASNTCLIFINQLRMKIGVFFGNPETTSGGRALRFYASVRLDVRRIGSIKDKDGVLIANNTRVKVAKNKVAPPFRECEFEVWYGQGINLEADLLSLAVKHKVIKQAGSYYKLDDQTLGQGRQQVLDLITSDAVLFNKVEREVLSILYPTLSDSETESEGEDASVKPKP